MDEFLDIFSGDAFSVRTLTDSLNLVPVQYGLVNQMGIFAEDGVNTTLVSVEKLNGVLNLIQSSERGTPAPKNKSGKRKAIPLEIPRIALDDVIKPQDIQNVRAFGSMNLQTPSSVVNDKLVELAMKHDITNEWHKATALRGTILDADGTVMLNLFDTFGTAEFTVDFALGNAGTKVIQKCAAVKRQIEKKLLNDTMTGVGALWAPDAWDSFINHANVVAAYQNYQNMTATAANFGAATANPLRDDVRLGFNFGGIVHREYVGTATDGAGNARDFIPAGTVRFFPIGSKKTFKTYYGPADWMETANTKGIKRYAKVYADPKGTHIDVMSQSCPLHLCLQPDVLVKGTA